MACGVLYPRYKRIKYKAFDEDGNPIEGILEDFGARILQHEVDHLNGILFNERVEDKISFGFETELCEAGIYPDYLGKDKKEGSSW